jgi:hypothetical protein
MPFVLVRTTPHVYAGLYLHSDELKPLLQELPGIIARALSVPGTEGELTPEEIEVKVEQFGDIDIHQKDVEIIIWANDYPERRKNLEVRTKQIYGQVKAILNQDTTSFIWVLLQKGSFITGNITDLL